MIRIIGTVLLLVWSTTAFCQDPLLDAAKKKVDAGDFAKAKAELTKFIEANPRNKIALNLRGQSKAGLSDFYGAIGDYNFALETDSTYAEALNNRGEAKMALGDDEGAVFDFDKAIKFNPKYSEA